MIKTAQDAYLAGRQAAMEKLAKNMRDYTPKEELAARGALTLPTVALGGYLGNKLERDYSILEGKRMPGKVPKSIRGRGFTKFLKRNPYTLGGIAAGGLIANMYYNQIRDKDTEARSWWGFKRR